MTRRDQVLRSWITRPAPGACWLSNVSFRGRVHQRTTHTKLRRAALEYNLFHTLEIIRPATTSTNSPTHQQPDLISFSHE